MAQLAIKGHDTLGREIVKILEMLGGRNIHNSWGVFANRIYTIDEKTDAIVDISEIHSSNYNLFTIEEFLEKYPYKTGDKVEYIKYDNEHPDVYTICNMKWTGNTIEYTLDSFGLTCLAKDIQLYKEETIKNKPNLLQQLKEYFDNTPREIIEREWHEYDKYNKISPKVNEYLEYVNNIRQPKYPKTFIEVLNFWHPDRQIEDDYQRCYKKDLLEKFQDLLYARDAYWKIAGEEMGLNKPWEPDYTDDNQNRYAITFFKGDIEKSKWYYGYVAILIFPTEEMRDAFYENFKDLVETCKEFL